MLKKYLYTALYFGALLLFSCGGASTAYQMDSTEKEKQRGYHANQANKIIDKNKANRSANAKSAERNRQKTNAEAAEAARLKKKNSSGKAKASSGKYSFY